MLLLLNRLSASVSYREKALGESERKITHPNLILNIFITEWTSSRRERNAVVHSFAAVIDRCPLSTASALAAAA